MPSEPGLTDFDRLSTPEKILRLQELWDRISSDPESIDLTEAQRTELDRRLRSLRSGASKTSAWSEVRERVRKRQ